VRYQKGSIGLNDRKDKALLGFVADSRYATHSQLLQFANLDDFEFRRRVFNWRVQRLVRHGLLRKQILPYLSGEALYSISRAGIEALERLGTYYLGANVEREKDPSEFQIPHALEINNIRLVLLRTGTLWSWTPESLIRVLNLSPTHSYAKVYDGIAKVFFDRQFAEFAVEYERTLKSLPKYEKIREAIESEKRLKAFLYLVPSWQLLSTLRDEFWGTKRLVFFGLAREFKEKAFDATVTTAMYDEMPLQGGPRDRLISSPDTPLMYPNGTQKLAEWSEPTYPTPSSMRNVDSTCDARVIPRFPQPEEV